MKNILFVFAAGLTMLSFNSCNKNYTCQCKNNISGDVIIGNIMTSSAKEARKHCKIDDPVTAQYYSCDIK